MATMQSQHHQPPYHGRFLLCELPDELMYLITGRIHDAKGFASVCKRFRTLAFAHIKHVLIEANAKSDLPDSLLPCVLHMTHLVSIDVRMLLDTESKMESFAKVLDALPHIQNLYLAHTRMHWSNPSLFCASLAKCTALRTLDISWNQLRAGSSFSPPLHAVISNLKELQTLLMYHTDLGTGTAMILATVIGQTKSLRHLQVGRCRFARDSFPCMLRNLTALTYLDLSFTNVHPPDLATSLSNLPSLQHLNISFTRMTHHESTFFASSLQHLTSLRYLALDTVCFNAIPLLVSLHALKSLQHLNLSSTMIRNAPAIANLISSLTHLQSLNLRCIGITSIGALPVAQSLPQLQFLTYLNLSDNDLGDTGALSLATFISRLLNLKDLRVTNARTTNEGACALVSCVRYLPALCRLHLEHNQLGNLAAETLASAFQHLPMLEWLYLGDNDIRTEGAVVLAESLHYLVSLTTLDLTGNLRISRVARMATTTAVRALIEARNGVRGSGTAWRLDDDERRNSGFGDFFGWCIRQATGVSDWAKCRDLDNTSKVR